MATVSLKHVYKVYENAEKKSARTKSPRFLISVWKFRTRNSSYS